MLPSYYKFGIVLLISFSVWRISENLYDKTLCCKLTLNFFLFYNFLLKAGHRRSNMLVQHHVWSCHLSVYVSAWKQIQHAWWRLNKFDFRSSSKRFFKHAGSFVLLLVTHAQLSSYSHDERVSRITRILTEVYWIV